MFNRVVHPGLILKDELGEAGVSLSEFARQIDVPANRISQIITGKRAITGDTALRFGHWFGTEPQFWLNLQSQYELAVADRQSGDAIRHLPIKGISRLIRSGHSWFDPLVTP
jgi:addiction module HigA family antidote